MCVVRGTCSISKLIVACARLPHSPLAIWTLPPLARGPQPWGSVPQPSAGGSPVSPFFHNSSQSRLLAARCSSCLGKLSVREHRWPLHIHKPHGLCTEGEEQWTLEQAALLLMHTNHPPKASSILTLSASSTHWSIRSSSSTPTPITVRLYGYMFEY